jgi:DNA (cytosine-5)-methyltransferase 1
LDAQYFGLAQRRRRVFVVASAREGFNPSEVLFEFSGERRDTAPSRKTGQGITADAETGFKLHETVGTLCADTHPGSYSGQDAYTGRLIPVISEPMCFEPRSPDGHARVIGNIAPCLNTMGGGQREPCVTYGIQGNMIGRADTAGPQGNGFSEEVGYTLTTGDVHGVATIAPPHVFKVRGGCEGGGKGYLGQDEQAFTITCGHDQQVAVANNAQYAVRRLTPVECERLQGFPDNYTNIPWRNKPEAPDGPRYKALGNSWAVPVVRWIGERVNFQILS